jgi:hypothetical protein
MLENFGLVPYESSVCKTGDRFGRYLVLAVGKKPGTYHYTAICQCDCGSPTRAVLISILRRGEAKSCGCLQLQKATKHGLRYHPMYNLWRGMHRRCYVTTDPSYKDYGGRGIEICDRWRDNLPAFIEDMFSTYEPGLTIDRINNDGPYSPDNCRWAPDALQRRNRRNNIQITMNGKTQVLWDWCRELGLNYGTIWERIQVGGWDGQIALTTPTTRR